MEKEENVVDEVEDFDIFEDVGRDYVCDPDQIMNDSKRRRVSFMTPRLEQIEKMKSSEIKNAAASILKSSLNEARVHNLKDKGKKKKKEGNGLRGMLLSSGYSNYDDDD